MESKLLDTITEIVGEGIVCVNAGGIVTHFNRKAKEITGIVLEGGRSHPAGSILPGDIVLIADNMLGDDDGGMTPEDPLTLEYPRPGAPPRRRGAGRRRLSQPAGPSPSTAAADHTPCPRSCVSRAAAAAWRCAFR